MAPPRHHGRFVSAPTPPPISRPTTLRSAWSSALVEWTILVKLAERHFSKLPISPNLIPLGHQAHAQTNFVGSELRVSAGARPTTSPWWSCKASLVTGTVASVPLRHRYCLWSAVVIPHLPDSKTYLRVCLTTISWLQHSRSIKRRDAMP